ncbi:hypothetical protein HCDG_05784 [Histoplasma capsulatum H143]|uniref:Uncharacterized protein n=1 Tax=Ajellomyces capsulatus (strain H143) TaxID=544712 RepID=C6HHV3_AJECH|nr:hypothetical protein HCDG_05784 [Histoplasma capsulatum H143]
MPESSRTKGPFPRTFGGPLLLTWYSSDKQLSLNGRRHWKRVFGLFLSYPPTFSKALGFHNDLTLACMVLDLVSRNLLYQEGPPPAEPGIEFACSENG